MARQHDIRLRRSNTANAIPTDSNLNLGELAINTADGALYFKKSDGTIITAIDNTIMHIDSANGRVGIGTNSPPQALSVQGRIVELNASGIQIVSIQASSNNGQIQINDSGGTDRILLNSAGTSYIRGGNLAVGTNSAASILTVEGDIRQTSGDLLFAMGGNANIKHLTSGQSITFDTNNGSSIAERMRIKSDGKVGIGTTSPNVRLHIADGSGDTTLAINNSTQVTGNTARIDLRHNGITGSQIKSSNVEDFTSSANRTSDLQFFTRNNGTFVQAMHLQEDGNVGIGNTNPGVPLDVNANSSAQGIRVRGRSSDDIGQIDLAINDGTIRSQLQWNNSFLNIKAIAAIPMIFYTNNAERMRIQSNGAVGIGTTSPSHPLHVVSAGNGEIKAERTGGTAILTQAQASLGRFGTTSNHNLQLMINSSARMTITTAGRIGIGTTSPADILHIVSSSGDVRQLMDAPAGSDAEIKFSEDGTVKFTVGHDAATDSLVIGTTNVDTQKRFEINASGVIKFNGAYTFPTSDGSAGQVLKTDGSGALTFQNDSGGGSAGTSITDADDDTKIQVEEGTDDDTIRFDTAGAERMIINSAGNIGVGTSSPTQKLSVNGNISLGDGHLIGDDASDNLVINSSSAESILLGSNQHIFFNTGATSLTSQGTTRMFINVSGNVGIGTSSPTGKIHVISGSTPSIAQLIIGYNNTSINYFDANTHIFRNGSSQEKARITSDGNLGIGTTSPGSKLHVANGTDTADSVRISGGHTGRYLGIRSFENDSLTGAGFILNASSSGGAFKFQTTSADRMIITQPGNVGIGTNTPGYRLEVAEDTDGTADLLFLRNSDSTYAQTWGFQSDTAKDLVITGSSGSGGVKLVPGSRGLMVIGNASTTGGLTVGDSSADVLQFLGELKQGSGSGLTIIDSSRRLQNLTPYSYTSLNRPGSNTSIVNSRLLNTRNAYVSNIPLHDSWHDNFAFRRYYNWTYETSTDNSSFSSATINEDIFDHDDATYYEVLGSTIKAVRWTMTNVSFNLGEYLQLSILYTASTPPLNVKVETSTDGSSYTTRLVETPSNSNSSALLYKLDAYGGATHMRITLSKQTISNTDTVEISRLCLWTARPGDQGKSKADHYPFDYVRREQINLLDNQKLQFGASQDLQIHHDGTNNLIQGSAGKVLYIQGRAGVNSILIVPDAAVNLYHNNNLKLETTSGGVTVTGGMTADSLSVDSLSMNGTSIGSTGNMTLDVTGDINLDAGGANINFNDDGSAIGHIEMAGQNLEIKSKVADKDLIFKGNDGGSTITALTLDMSSEGDAIFNNDILLGDGNPVRFGTDQDFRIWFDGSHANIHNTTSNSDIYIKGNDGGSTITALTLDMSEAGRATFNSDVIVGGNLTVNGTSTTINTTTLDVEDKNITLNKGSGDTSASADGAGITVQDAVNSSTDATLLWNASNNIWALSHRLSAPQFIVSDTNAIIYRNSNDLELKTYSGYDINLMPAGNVGIGTTNPDEQLHISNATPAVIRLERNDTTISSGNTIGNIEFEHQESGGAGLCANFAVKADTGAGAGAFVFETGAAGTLTEKVRFTSGGNVGIGTNNPTSKLEVHGSVGTIPDTTNSSLQLRDTSAVGANNGGSIVFSGIYTGTSGFLGSGPYIKAYKLNSTSGDYSYGLKFATRQNGVGSQAIGLTITPDQKVGIGTTNPNALLEINSDGSASGGAEIRLQHANNNSTDVVSTVNFANNAGSVAMIQGGTTGANNTGYISFHTDNAGTSSEAMRILAGNQVAVNAGSARTTGGTAQLTIAGSSSLINMGPSNSDNMYIRRMGAGLFQMQTYNNDNAGHIELEPYGGNVGIGTGATAPTQRLEVGGNVKLSGASSHFINLEPSGSVGNANIAFDGSNFTFTSNSSSADMVFQTSSTTRMTLQQNGYLDLYSGGSENQLNVGRNSNEKLNIRVTDGNIELTANQDADGNATHVFSLNRVFAGSGANNFDIQKDGTFQLRLDTNGYLYMGGVSNAYLRRNSSNQKLENHTSHGYITFGPANTSFAHIETDRGEFYFNKALTVNSGIVRSYDEDLALRRESVNKAIFGTTNTDLTNNVRIAGALGRSFGNTKVREYRIASGAGTQSFLLGKIEHGGGSDGAIDGVIKFAHDYGDSAISSSVHFHFAQRSNTARGHWWYEHTDDDVGSDVIKAVLIDDGSGGMFVWVTVGDYAECYVEATFRQCSIVTDSGTLTAGTLTSGTTLFDTSNDPTSEMHIGKLYGHDDLNVAGTITGTQDFKATGNNMKLHAGGNHIINIDLNGNFYPQTHNAVDLGFSDTLAFRNLHLVGAITGGASITSGTITATAPTTNFHTLSNASSNGTVLKLTTTGDNREMTLQSDHIFSNGAFYLGSNSQTTNYRASTHNFEGGSVDIEGKLRHRGDTDNYIHFSAADTQSYVTGNSTRLQITNSLVRFNQEGNNQDFQVFGSSVDNLLYIDASADRIGVGTNTPADKLHITGGNILLENALELRQKDTGGNIRTITRVNSSNELEYGWSANGAVKFMGGGSYTERMRIHTNSTIGVGVIAPHAGATMHISADDTTPDFTATNIDDCTLVLSNGDTAYGTVFGQLGTGVGVIQARRTTSAVYYSLSLSPHGGNVGIGELAPDRKLHVTETALSGAAPTTYAHMILEDTDAQMDLISSQDGTWGSAINFKEHYSTNASLNDVWSIARKTTNGDGDSSLNFNFGTSNQHDNTQRQKFYADGRIDAVGAIESTSGGLRANSSELIQRRVGGWTVPLQTVVYSGYGTNLGDYAYLKAPGNSTAAHGTLIVGDNSLYYGRSSIETGGVTNSTEAPLDESVAFKIDQGGDARFKTRIGIGVFPASNNNSNNHDTTEANRVAPLHIRTTANSGAGTQVAQIIENYANDYGTTPLKLALDFKGQDSNNNENYVRLAQVSVNDTDYGVNNEATSHFIMGMTDAGTYNETHMFHARGHFLMGNSTAFHPTNQVNSGTYFKPDTNGKFLNVSGGSHGSFINLMSDTTTDNDQIGGIYWTRTAGAGDAHKQVAGIDVTQQAYAPTNTLEGGNLRFFTKQSGSGNNVPRLQITSNGEVQFMDSGGNADMRWNQSNLILNDNNKLALGTSSEFLLYHTDSGNSIISETGSGSLYIDGSNIYLRKSTASGEAMADFVADGAVTLYHNGVAKFETQSNGIKASGTALGNTAGNSIQLASFANAVSNASQLRIFTERDASGTDWQTAMTRIQQRIDVTDQAYIQFNGTDLAYGLEIGTHATAGEIRLNHRGTVRLKTNNSGVEVTGLLSATTKSFDIEHPTKEGKRLRYGVLEGPEHGVYVRGKSNSYIIELPEEWTGLVHEDSITVQLTAIGKPQELYVENIEDNKIYIASERTIGNYFYYVQAERKDVDKIEVEYDVE